MSDEQIADVEIIGRTGPRITVRSNIRHVVHVVHNVNYGTVFDCEHGTFYDRIINVKIDQKKLPPKITSEQQIKRQKISDDFWNHFKIISYSEFVGIDFINYQQTQ